MRHLLLVILVACGHKDSSPPPPTKTVEASPAASAPTGPVITNSGCTRAAQTLVKAWSHRWSGSEMVSGDNEQSIAAAKIEQICKTDKWAATVETCLNGRGDPWRCVDEAKLVAELPPAGLDLSCKEAVIHDVSSLGVKGDGEILTIGQQLMKDELATICAKQGWSDTMLGCLYYVGDEPAKVQTCIDTWLTEDQAKELKTQFDAFAARVNGWSSSPPSCDKVAMAFYSDDAWAKHPTPELSEGARKQAIVDSRKKLTAHCKKEMSPVLRGCVAAATSEEGAWHCWWTSDDHTASNWGFPVGKQG